MALNIDPASIAEALRRNVESWTPSVEREEVSRVTETANDLGLFAEELKRRLREEIHELFLKHVMQQAPGYGKLTGWTGSSSTTTVFRAALASGPSGTAVTAVLPLDRGAA